MAEGKHEKGAGSHRPVRIDLRVVGLEVACKPETSGERRHRPGLLSRFDEGELHVAGSKSGYASFAIGTSPVGITVRPDGMQVWVALPDRFSAAGAGKLAGITPVDDASDKLPSTSVVGGFPREVSFLPDGRTLVATVFDAERIELLPTP